MAKKGKAREYIKMKSTESHYMYHTEKNKTNSKVRLELKKFDPTLNRVVIFREEK